MENETSKNQKNEVSSASEHINQKPEVQEIKSDESAKTVQNVQVSPETAAAVKAEAAADPKKVQAEHEALKAEAVKEAVSTIKAEEIKEDKESSKKATIALVLGIIALVFLAGTKLIVGNLFFYLGALILGAIALYFAMKTTQMTKKAVLALVIAASPVVVAGYNLTGIAVRDAIIDAEFHHMEHEIDRDVRSAEEFLPDMMDDFREDFARMDEDLKNDAQEFEQKVKEDAAKSDTASAQTQTSSSESSNQK